MKKRFIFLFFALLSSLTASAVLNEQTLAQTISVLKSELERTYVEESAMKEKYDAINKMQHRRVIKTVQESEKISLMLYSQREDYIFDMAYACHEATSQYRDFKSKRAPFDNIIKKLNVEIEKYTLLIETLENIPPTKRWANRDSLRQVRQREDSIRKALETATAAYEAEKYGRVQVDSSSGVGINIFGHQLGGGDSIVVTSAEDAMRIAQEQRDSLTLAKAREMIKGVNDVADTATVGGLRLPQSPRSARRLNMSEMQDFLLSPESQVERDSCIELSKKILADYVSVRDYIVRDRKLYDRVDQRLKAVNDYALGRYEAIQHNIFTNGGISYFTVLGNFPTYVRIAVNDLKEKYTDNSNVSSDWHGPTIIGFILFILAFFLLAFAISKIVVWLYSRKRSVSPVLVRYYTITLTCVFFTGLLTLTRFAIAQNFFMMACSRLIEYMLLIAAIILSVVYRTRLGQIRSAFSCYFPILLMGLVIIIFRIMFVPNNLVTVLFPPLLIVFTVWGFRSVMRHHANIPRYDEIYAWISLTIMTVACVMAWMGYALLSVELFIWWLVQLTCVQALTFISECMKAYERRRVAPRIMAKEGVVSDGSEAYKERLSKKIEELQKNKGNDIVYTWFFDFVMLCAIPVCAVLSFLLCIYLATDIFDLTAMCKSIFFTNFLDIEGLCQLSLFKLVVVFEFFFIFRFLSYIIRAIYRHWLHKSKKAHEIENANITLVNNVIAIVVWGIYFIFVLFLLQVPKSGISIVSAGLATGLGFAMRDMINNFFYGITLMTGRVRVGDFIECDGVRGKVESITYQSTQLITLDGCVVAFLNSSLFTKTFKNLTRNHGYELVKIPVGVAYGTNVETVRKVLVDRLESMRNVNDAKPNIDPEKEIRVLFVDFGESSVDLQVIIWVRVENMLAVVARAKEMIYETLNENHIEIPFPQRDLHVITSSK